MNNMPLKLRKQLAELPQVCARLGDDCEGVLTYEHALLYAGKQVQAKFAVVFLCWYHHLGAGLDKRWNIRKALSQATPEDLKKYPRQTWRNQC